MNKLDKRTIEILKKILGQLENVGDSINQDTMNLDSINQDTINVYSINLEDIEFYDIKQKK